MDVPQSSSEISAAPDLMTKAVEAVCSHVAAVASESVVLVNDVSVGLRVTPISVDVARPKEHDLNFIRTESQRRDGKTSCFCKDAIATFCSLDFVFTRPDFSERRRDNRAKANNDSTTKLL